MENRPEVMYGSIYLEKGAVNINFPQCPEIPQSLQRTLPPEELKDLFVKNVNDYNNTVQIIAKEVKEGLSGMKIDYFVGKHINNIDMSSFRGDTTTTTTDSYNRDSYNRKAKEILKRHPEETDGYKEIVSKMTGGTIDIMNKVIEMLVVIIALCKSIICFKDNSENQNSKDKMTEEKSVNQLLESLRGNFKTAFDLNGIIDNDVITKLKDLSDFINEKKDSDSTNAEAILDAASDCSPENLNDKLVQKAISKIQAKMYENDARKTKKYSEELVEKHANTSLENVDNLIKFAIDTLEQRSDQEVTSDRESYFLYTYNTPMSFFDSKDSRTIVPFGISTNISERIRSEIPNFTGGTHKEFVNFLKERNYGDKKAYLFNTSTIPIYLINVGEKDLMENTEANIKDKLKDIKPSVVNYNDGNLIGKLINKKLLNSFAPSADFKITYPDLVYSSLEGCCADGANSWILPYAFAGEYMKFKINELCDFANLSTYEYLISIFGDDNYENCKPFQLLISKICDLLVTKTPLTTYVIHAIFDNGIYKRWIVDINKDLDLICRIRKEINNSLSLLVTLPYINDIDLIEEEFKTFCPEYQLNNRKNTLDKTFVMYSVFNLFLLKLQEQIPKMYKGDYRYYDNYSDKYLKHIKEENLNVNTTPIFHDEFVEIEKQRKEISAKNEGNKSLTHCELVELYITVLFGVALLDKNRPYYGYADESIPYSEKFAKSLESYVKTTDGEFKDYLVKKMLSIYNEWQEKVHAKYCVKCETKTTNHNFFWAFPKIYNIVYDHPELYDDKQLGDMVKRYKDQPFTNYGSKPFLISSQVGGRDHIDKKSTLDKWREKTQGRYKPW